MNMYDSLKRHYEADRYSKAQLKVFVKAKWITAEQYEEITGESYVA